MGGALVGSPRHARIFWIRIIFPIYRDRCYLTAELRALDRDFDTPIAQNTSIAIAAWKICGQPSKAIACVHEMQLPVITTREAISIEENALIIYSRSTHPIG
jgi:hypothetical protein